MFSFMFSIIVIITFVRIHIYIMKIYGIRTEDKIVECGDRNQLHYSCANLSQSLLLTEYLILATSSAFWICLTIIKPFRAML